MVRAVRHTAGSEALARAGAGWRSDSVQREVPIELPLESGQTVGGVLAGLDLPAGEAGVIVEELSEYADLRRLRPEDSYAVVTDPDDGSLRAFDLTLAGRGRVRVAREAAGWKASWHQFERQTQLLVVRGTLEGALESSINRAGGDGRLAFLLSEVFQWDLDFRRQVADQVAGRHRYSTSGADSGGGLVPKRTTSKPWRS